MLFSSIRENVEAIYIDYYNGAYTDEQLKQMLKKLYLKSSIDVSTWSEILLDAQWKFATEEDYQHKREQLQNEFKREEGGLMFFCDCGGLLLVEAVEDYPDLLHPSDKLQYERKCKAKCAECAKVYTDLNYD